MNRTIYKTAKLCGLSAVTIALITFTTQAQAGPVTGKKPIPPRVTEITQDQFQLTLSNVPYSANANDAYVRNACTISKKKKKPNS